MPGLTSRGARETARLLAGLGLEPRGRSRRRTGPAPGAEPAPRRARTALARLGPLWAALGAYLATRTDLLPLRTCVVLAGADQQDAGPASLPTAEVEALAGPLAGRLTIEPEPVHRTWCHQWHHGTLIGAAGDLGSHRVVVKLVRTDLERQLAEDGERLEVLDRFVICDDGPDQPGLRPAAHDLLELLDRRLDLRNEAATLSRLGRVAAAGDTVLVPRIHAELSSRRVLVRDRLEGATLAEVLGGSDQTDDPDLARRLIFAWLHLALLGGLCLDDLEPADVVACPGGRIGLAGGTLTELSRGDRDRLLEYLVRAVHHEPDLCGEQLLDLCTALPGPRAAEHLRVELRQAAPFRSGGWTEAFAGERLAPVLFVHWRALERAGGRPGRALAALQAGLTRLELAARRLAPDQDSLEAALADLRLSVAITRLREELGPSRLRHNAVRLLSAIDTVASHADRIVRDRAAGRPRAPDRARSDAARPDVTRGRWTGLLAAGLLIAMAALALAGSDPDPPLSQPVAAIAYLGLAAVLVLVLEHRPRRRATGTPGALRSPERES